MSHICQNYGETSIVLFDSMVYSYEANMAFQCV